MSPIGLHSWGWARGRITAALAMVRVGLSYRETGAWLGTTRGAIAGVIHRYGDSAPCHPDPPTLDERLRWDRVTGGGCRWVIGDPRRPDWNWCGAKIYHGSYCIDHHQRAWKRA